MVRSNSPSSHNGNREYRVSSASLRQSSMEASVANTTTSGRGCITSRARRLRRSSALRMTSRPSVD